MNTVLKYAIGLDLLNCHAKFNSDTISRSRESDVWSCYLWQFSGYSRTEILTSAVVYGQPGVTMFSCTSCRVTVLILFVRVKLEARRSFWIELAAPYTLANHCEINSQDILPLIIFLTPVSCNGSNYLWRQRLLLLGVSLNDISFSSISAFTACFAFGFLVYCLVRTEWPYRIKTVFILIAL